MGGGEGSLSGNNEAIGPHPKLQLPVTLALGINFTTDFRSFQTSDLKIQIYLSKGKTKGMGIFEKYGVSLIKTGRVMFSTSFHCCSLFNPTSPLV